MNTDDSRLAIEVLRRGGIVIYPTDTAYGIGCRIDYPESVDRLFALRERATTKATPVLVDSYDMALAYFVNPNDIVRRLMKVHWPGALTIVSACDRNQIYSPIRGGGSTIGLRMPNHDMALGIIRGVGVPILGTSANFSGGRTPFVAEELDPDLVKLVDMVVPGTCGGGSVSTVVDCTKTPAVILRHGAVELSPQELL